MTPATNRPAGGRRVGNQRTIIAWDRERDVPIVETVVHRRNVYDCHLPQELVPSTAP